MLLLIAATALSADLYAATPDPASPRGIEYRRYHTQDKYGRRIEFYVDTVADNSKRLPIATYILGSGSYSRFRLRDGKLLSPDVPFLRKLAGRARLVLVEKPGVKFGEHVPIGDLPEFRREHTLPRWVEAISAALKAARTLPAIDTERLLVVGHSEGAQVAASVAAANPFVTDVACLAGASASQLYLSLRARRADEKRLREYWQQWREQMQHPDDPDRLRSGHSFRYWTSFLASSALEELPKTKARVLLAQGSLDGPDAAGDLDVVLATIASKGQDATSALMHGANHAFQFPNAPERDGLAQMQDRVLAWFFGGPGCDNDALPRAAYCESLMELSTK
jgi:pimeloyl-ACP methyl ester carboxylesterase